MHRTTTLRADEVTNVQGIAVTTVARTIRDLATTLSQADLERTIQEAQAQGKLTPVSLGDAVDEARGRRGAPALRAASDKEAGVTRSKMERKLREAIRRAGLKKPRTNAKIGRWEVDAIWDEERVIVEVDGYAAHASRWAFERDRRKDAELQAMGFAVLRFTWRQLSEEPEAVTARIAAVSAVRNPGAEVSAA